MNRFSQFSLLCRLSQLPATLFAHKAKPAELAKPAQQLRRHHA